MLWTTFRNLFANGYVTISLNNQMSSVQVHVILSSSQVCGWLCFFLRLVLVLPFRVVMTEIPEKSQDRFQTIYQIIRIHCFTVLPSWVNSYQG